MLCLYLARAGYDMVATRGANIMWGLWNTRRELARLRVQNLLLRQQLATFRRQRRRPRI
jgi:hypothetical protein